MTVRKALEIHGVVQGVGFRPWVYRVATRHGLSGWVKNGGQGVRIELQGPVDAVDAFIEALKAEGPPGAKLTNLTIDEMDLVAQDGFRIECSLDEEASRPILAADLAPCNACLHEIETASDRRYRYPFTNCTQCGPRYTIVWQLPYDRQRTTMRDFSLCEACMHEYVDPGDRRFHAEPVACASCGPRLQATDTSGTPLAVGDDALSLVVERLHAGAIVAMKGVGGYQLLVAATDDEAVARLRERKQRPHKPFAVMFRSIDMLRWVATLDPADVAALTSAEAPIVLVRRAEGASQTLSDRIAPASPWIGAMLPSSPLHHLLMAKVDEPLVCTSGNLSEEPICTGDDEALGRLASIADLFLAHNRPIVRPVDDSVGRLGAQGFEVLRRARGFAPRSLRRTESGPTVLALGGHLKNTVALAIGSDIVVSQHLGDMESPQARTLLQQTADDLLAFFKARPDVIACDLHPDYASTTLAHQLGRTVGVPVESVQHHHAHVAAVMAESGIEGPVLGFAWDGTGYGVRSSPQTIWGGEALVCKGAGAWRAAHLRSFPLLGGDRASREPRRAALGLVWTLFGVDARTLLKDLFSDDELRVLLSALAAGVPQTTSIGRLFDGIAALCGWQGCCTFEGQAAMDLEYATEGILHAEPYPMPLVGQQPIVMDWEPLIRAILDDQRCGVSRGVISARFHETLAMAATEVARRVDVRTVVLSGGCFQNLILAKRARARLEASGFSVVTPRDFPTNDGGLSLGQAFVVTQRYKEKGHVPWHSR